MKAATRKPKTKAAGPLVPGAKRSDVLRAAGPERVNTELIVALVIASLTDLVEVDDTVDPFTVDPEDLFMFAFNDPRVGLTNEQMEFFKANLTAALPKIAKDIAEINADARLNIGKVADFVRAALANAGVRV